MDQPTKAYRSTKEDSYKKVGETTAAAYTDTNLDQSTLYYYKIYAVDNAGVRYSIWYCGYDSEGRYSTPPTNSGTPNVVVGSTTAIITWGR